MDLIIGEIVQVCCEEKSVSDNKPDCEKIDPLLFFMPEGPYLKTGNRPISCLDAQRLVVIGILLLGLGRRTTEKAGKDQKKENTSEVALALYHLGYEGG